MAPHTVIFDLDGTLLDSIPDLAAAANAARATLGLAPLPAEAVEAGVGWGLGHLLRHVLPPDAHEQLPALRAAFIAAYQQAPMARGGLYPGAEALVAAWPRTRLGLVTNKPRMFLDPILTHLGWGVRFGAVVAGDDLPERKPDPAPLRAAMRALGVVPGQVLFVGDSEVDAETARRAGVEFAAVPWGRVAPTAARVLASLHDLRPAVSG
ncbi:MAG: HAD-IA family hydrolase [Myxococcales bacterium]|nr:HAD-IA family hydrolase [Myxococcales bacterium]